ncbi:MAG: hypothetical protein H7836_16925 [Magnetococcus sp. YQC-3]
MIDLKHLKEGDSFKQNQLIAWSSSFDGERLTLGRNLKVAIMNYEGFSFEDFITKSPF